MSTTIDATAIPIPGMPAYWTAQREAVAMLHAYNFGTADLWVKLDRLHRIAAHGFAARMMAAQGNDLHGMIRQLQRMADDIDFPDPFPDYEDGDPDAPPSGEDCCARACQILHGRECSICGFDGHGIWASDLDTVAGHCFRCRVRAYQNVGGACELCGKDAGTPDAPAPQPALCFQDCCGIVTTDSQCGLCRDLERQARSIVAQAEREARAQPDLATAAALARTALHRCSAPPAEAGRAQP